MLTYLVRRIVFGAAVLVGTSLITFLIAFVVPADPAIAMAGAKADPQTLASIRRELHLDQPLYVQYSRYVERAVLGDLGRSYIRRENVTRLIADRQSAASHFRGGYRSGRGRRAPRVRRSANTARRAADRGGVRGEWRRVFADRPWHRPSRLRDRREPRTRSGM